MPHDTKVLAQDAIGLLRKARPGDGLLLCIAEGEKGMLTHQGGLTPLAKATLARQLLDEIADDSSAPEDLRFACENANDELRHGAAHLLCDA